MVRTIIIAVSILLLLIVSPIVVTIAGNEWRLWKFARQLDWLEEVAPGRLYPIARGSQIYTAGNHNACTFNAIIVFRSYLFDASIKERIKSAKYEPVEISKFNKSADVNVFEFPLGLGVTIKDGPYSAGLDFRCW